MIEVVGKEESEEMRHFEEEKAEKRRWKATPNHRAYLWWRRPLSQCLKVVFEHRSSKAHIIIHILVVQVAVCVRIPHLHSDTGVILGGMKEV